MRGIQIPNFPTNPELAYFIKENNQFILTWYTDQGHEHKYVITLAAESKKYHEINGLLSTILENTSRHNHERVSMVSYMIGPTNMYVSLHMRGSIRSQLSLSRDIENFYLVLTNQKHVILVTQYSSLEQPERPIPIQKQLIIGTWHEALPTEAQGGKLRHQNYFLKDRTVKQLREVAKRRKIALTNCKTKADILAKLR